MLLCLVPSSGEGDCIAVDKVQLTLKQTRSKVVIEVILGLSVPADEDWLQLASNDHLDGKGQLVQGPKHCLPDLRTVVFGMEAAQGFLQRRNVLEIAICGYISPQLQQGLTDRLRISRSQEALGKHAGDAPG